MIRTFSPSIKRHLKDKEVCPRQIHRQKSVPTSAAFLESDVYEDEWDSLNSTGLRALLSNGSRLHS